MNKMFCDLSKAPGDKLFGERELIQFCWHRKVQWSGIV